LLLVEVSYFCQDLSHRSIADEPVLIAQIKKKEGMGADLALDFSSLLQHVNDWTCMDDAGNSQLK